MSTAARLPPGKWLQPSIVNPQLVTPNRNGSALKVLTTLLFLISNRGSDKPFNTLMTLTIKTPGTYAKEIKKQVNMSLSSREDFGK